MLWATSSFALYIPWAHKAGPYLGISLWLWLGVLDAIQGAGLGMILLQVNFRNYLASVYNIVVSDTLTSSRLCNFGIFSDPWFNLCDGCPRHSPQQD
jgi:hypothetical protein